MALVHCMYHSDILRRDSAFYALLPERMDMQPDTEPVPGNRYQVLYLLHGLTDDASAWLRKPAALELYAQARQLIVILPDAGCSFYTDMACGDAYFSLVAEEIPRVAGTWFPLSKEREDTFVAGYSMGGYGALKLALRRPERYAAAASLSGALDIQKSANAALAAGDSPFRPALVFKDPGALRGSDDDLFALVKRADKAALPALRLYCGEQDSHLGLNRDFAALCAAEGVAAPLSVTPGGHDWAYWDKTIQRVLKDLPLKGKPIRP